MSLLPLDGSTLRTLALVGLLAAGACDSMELAPGDVNDIYVAVDRDLWMQVRDTLGAALQPTVLTVTDEMAFQVVDVDPAGQDWGRIRTFKQLLVIGTPDDPWIGPVLAEAERDGSQAPLLFAERDVWSRNQLVTALVLPADDPDMVVERLDELHRHYDDLYREWALARMFVSGRDSALADTLAREHGFSMLLPEVYRWSRRDSTYIFRNDNPSPDELIRQITVAWRTPVPEGLDSLFAVPPMVDWRQEVGDRTLTVAQVVDTGRVRAGALDYRGSPAFEVQAVWQNPPEADWPAGGPFITRSIACEGQDRLYLVDAWLYAPGRDKYEYMIQLNTILDSFRCGG
jgi:hypothetical protein